MIGAVQVCMVCVAVKFLIRQQGTTKLLNVSDAWITRVPPSSRACILHGRTVILGACNFQNFSLNLLAPAHPGQPTPCSLCLLA